MRCVNCKLLDEDIYLFLIVVYTSVNLVCLVLKMYLELKLLHFMLCNHYSTKLKSLKSVTLLYLSSLRHVRRLEGLQTNHMMYRTFGKFVDNEHTYLHPAGMGCSDVNGIKKE